MATVVINIPMDCNTRLVPRNRLDIQNRFGRSCGKKKNETKHLMLQISDTIMGVFVWDLSRNK